MLGGWSAKESEAWKSPMEVATRIRGPRQETGDKGVAVMQEGGKG